MASLISCFALEPKKREKCVSIDFQIALPQLSADRYAAARSFAKGGLRELLILSQKSPPPDKVVFIDATVIHERQVAELA